MAQTFTRLSVRDKILSRLRAYPVITKSQVLLGNTHTTIPEIEAALNELMQEGVVSTKEIALGKTVYDVYFLAEAEPLVEQYHAQHLAGGVSCA